MKRRAITALTLMVPAAAVMALLTTSSRPAGADDETNALTFRDSTGQFATVVASGGVDATNPFFQDLGTNGRRCVTCHQPGAAWSVTPANIAERFLASTGADPIFISNDGSNCEGATPHSLFEKTTAYSLLLSRGLFRIGLDVPSGAEFVIDRVTNPYRCTTATNDASLYRRPLPSTNLRFLSAVMWDGRESSAATTILDDLAHQANDATRGHAQAARDLTASEIQQIVSFESGLFTAQTRDARAGNLRGDHASGGPAALSGQTFFMGINDPVGMNPAGDPFDASAFTVFAAWAPRQRDGDDQRDEARRAIARGEKIFDTKLFVISSVSGLNGETFPSGVTVPAAFNGTCTVCHDTPNAGTHSVKAALNIGISDPGRAPYLPVYTLRNLATQQTLQTTDPGRAMITGKWRDVGKFKGPVLRALAARAPYFHNGSAMTLEEVAEFYDTRFHIGFTPQEKADLVAFLRAL